jgi:hypothetical protein
VILDIDRDRLEAFELRELRLDLVGRAIVSVVSVFANAGRKTRRARSAGRANRFMRRFG